MPKPKTPKVPGRKRGRPRKNPLPLMENGEPAPTITKRVGIGQAWYIGRFPDGFFYGLQTWTPSKFPWTFTPWKFETEEAFKAAEARIQTDTGMTVLRPTVED